MFRVFLVCFFMIFVNAETIHFQEEKYIEVIGNSFYKKGTLEFEDTRIKLQYNNSDKILIYDNDSLVLVEKEQQIKLDQDKQIVIKMVFLLIGSIYHNDMQTLEEFFTINPKENETLLIPKEGVSRYIQTIRFSKKNQRLNYLEFIMQNGDITTIKQIDG